MSRFLARFIPVLLLLTFALALSEGARPVAARGSGSISGRLIQDTDGDGDMGDVSEPGLAGWHVRLEMDTGTRVIVHETVTNNDGRYSFSRLAPGDYNVSIPCDGQPSSWLVTAPDTGGVWSATVEADEDSGGIDFWLSLLSAPPPHNGEIVGRLVWDENADGVPDLSESGVAGWQVNASMAGGPKCFPQQYQVTYAGSDGSFSFTGLQPGLYDLGYPGPSGRPHPDYVFDAPGIGQQMPDGYEYFSFLSGVEAPENGSGSIAIGILDVSGTGSISGEIYADSNENGQQDAGEPLVDCGCWMGLMYRTPHGYSPVLSRITYTSSGGLYGLSGLRGGQYWVALLQPPGVPIAPPVGPSGFSFHLVTLKDGEELANIDFGLRVQPGQPTRLAQPTPASTPAPLPSATPLMVPPSVDCGPVCVGSLSPPATGSGAAPSHGDLAGWAAALAVAGALAVGASALAVRRKARFRR